MLFLSVGLCASSELCTLNGKALTFMLISMNDKADEVLSPPAHPNEGEP